MAAIPKFSFSGWTSSRISPQVNPASVPVSVPAAAPGKGFAKGPGASIEGGMSIENGIVYQNGKLIGPIGSPAAMALGTVQGQSTNITNPATTGVQSFVGGPGQLVGQTNAANTNLPAWLQTEMDRLNAQDALRTQLAGQVTGGGGPAAPAFDPNLGVAAVTNARANYNAQINQVNEQARLQNLVQQRNQIRPGGFGFTNPFDVNRLIGLGNQIQDYQNVNLPLASNAVSGIRRNASGWVQPMWA